MSNNVINGGLGYKGERGDDGVSPVITTSKTDGVATITITDVEGTKTVQLSDGEITKAMVVDNLTTTTTDVPLSAKQGKVLNDKINNLITIVGGAAPVTRGSTESTFTIDLSYPEGYNIQNTMILSVMLWGRYNLVETGYDNYSIYKVTDVYAGEHGITVDGKYDTVIGDDNIYVRVAIMKTTINPWEKL